MSALQIQLVCRAISRYGKISPCGKQRALQECFSIYKNSLYFWFNSTDGSTHAEFINLGACSASARMLSGKDFSCEEIISPF